ncbi:MAG: hypothetical protein LBR23_05010 [Spirochaetaceae bacterium]|jgi:hypothetical protein|nr:hypothetical protein [Spirochaetaceae bacterium]
MTDEEREIRNAERRCLAEVRRWKRKVQKRTEGMTIEQLREHYDNLRKEWAEKYNVNYTCIRV